LSTGSDFPLGEGYVRLLIDGDPIVYAAAFAAEDEDVAHALHNAKRIVNGIVTAARDYGAEDVGYETFLTGTGNFRERVATIKPYKGNRSRVRPKHYESVRLYLQEHCNAQIVNDWEADDEISIRMQVIENKGAVPVAASIDKDLCQIQGYLLNYRTGVLRYTSLPANHRFLWWQVLAGDSVDNIGGCWKVGPRKAEAILDEAEKKGGGYLAAVWDAYTASLDVPGCPYTDARAAMDENYQLCALLTRRGWVPNLTNVGRYVRGYAPKGTPQHAII
jgi:hypothetical protein